MWQESRKYIGGLMAEEDVGVSACGRTNLIIEDTVRTSEQTSDKSQPLHPHRQCVLFVWKVFFLNFKFFIPNVCKIHKFIQSISIE